MTNRQSLKDLDPEVYAALEGERERQAEGIELIASENFVSPAVLEATRRRCRELGLSYHETSGWDDLDDLADLQRLVERSPGSLTARHIVGELAALF